MVQSIRSKHYIPRACYPSPELYLKVSLLFFLICNREHRTEPSIAKPKGENFETPCIKVSCTNLAETEAMNWGFEKKTTANNIIKNHDD